MNQETKKAVAFNLHSAPEFSARILKGESPIEALERKAKRLFGKKASIFENHEVSGRFEVVNDGNILGAFFSPDLV